MVHEDNKDAQRERLEHEIASLEQKNERLTRGLMAARTTITDLSAQLEAVMKPPRTYATFLAVHRDSISEATVTAMVNGRMMELALSDSVDCTRMMPGQQLLLNEQLVIVGSAGYVRTGELVAVKMLMDHDRALVSLNSGEERVVYLSGRLMDERVRPGDVLLADMRSLCAVEAVERPDVQRLMLEETPNVRYCDVGGLEDQIEKIRDAIELPFKHPQLYREHGLKPPQGVLLYGPPGCGKTMIAKAVATHLAHTPAFAGDSSHDLLHSGDRTDNQDQAQQTHAYFLNVKGPQLLDKYVGETERKIREIFARARELAGAGLPVVIFFDEMEALFRARGSGISSDVETTIVPQLLAEIDGVEQLDNVIVIGASNREDMIDPAVLRPGRLDIKIKIDRPTQEDAYAIMLKYLTESLPIHEDAIRRYGTKEKAVKMFTHFCIWNGKLYS